jgi:hypothetical protein
MGEAGRRMIKQKFSCEAQLEKTQTLYDQVLARALPVRSQTLNETSEKMS